MLVFWGLWVERTNTSYRHSLCESEEARVFLSKADASQGLMPIRETSPLISVFHGENCISCEAG